MAHEPSRNDQPFKRLFFALSVDEAPRRAIAQWRQDLCLRVGKPVAADNFHVTLLFVGDVSADQMPSLIASVGALKHPRALRLQLDRLNVWLRPQILVLEPIQAPPALLRLAYDLAQTLRPLGIVEQPHDYRPHLTLSRDFHQEVPETPLAPDFMLVARHFTLFESRKGQYWPVAEWPLED
ncbi:RNA 2',3'-cyclic phosphodiesterase [Pseudomonas putida]|uniref:RNA 2',3'-cyclic phosphodiesterase n=1 Tax=Pseudomonas putida TaxID=303 RepID=UPI001F085FC7|nr:RNA 2',3'-cyclic phosphodiesterase [Pseudomonas putida]